MFRKTMVLFWICFMGLMQPAIPAGAKQTEYVEIFDPVQRRVVKEIQRTPEIQRIVTGWLMTAEEPCAKLNPMPKDGYVVRVPLTPTPALRSRWLYADVENVYIAIPSKEPPFFILVGDDSLFCYLFHGDISLLSAALDFALDAK